MNKSLSGKWENGMGKWGTGLAIQLCFNPLGSFLSLYKLLEPNFEAKISV